SEEGDAPVGIPELRAQPEVDADAGMDPDGRQGRDLDQREMRHEYPMQNQHRAVIVVGAEESLREPRARDVQRKQQRDAEAEAELRPLPRRKPERAPLEDR